MQETLMEEGALRRVVKDEGELVKVPGEEKVSFQARSHGGERKNGVVRSHKHIPMAGVVVSGGELQREDGANSSGTIVPR